ncbi:GDP-fucose transporter 1 isoform X2 [Ctenocephalides felis]|uniref:GDP-fucose transporter 1 isoform X2 n=1 Tax=Ctenocephalides felis TaxID=7515 RepID=UPI000E6E3FA9|nr:GDP-fucose transporter 1 isoform X2 [Ctenocephalides felis]
MQEETLLNKYAKILVVVCAYWVISICTVFINKILLSSQEVNLDAPLFITWFQCLVSAGICYTASNLSKAFPQKISFPKGNPWSIQVAKHVLPLSILFTAMISTNNLCLKYVHVSFYYIGRSLTTVFNVILSYTLLQQKTSFRCILCCGIIVGGFWLGVDQEQVAGSLSIIGTIFGVLGSLSLCLYSIYTKRTLPHVNQEIWLLSYYNNVYSCILFLPLIVMSGEHRIVASYPLLASSWFWSVMIIGGICGFSIGFVTALQIKVTSPLTHNISGTAKACAQTILASQWFSEPKAFLWWLSNFVVLGGSMAYARIKQLEMEKAHRANVSP